MTPCLDLFPGHAWLLHCCTSLYSLFHLQIILSAAFRSTRHPLHLALQALPKRLLHAALISYSCLGWANPYWVSNLSDRSHTAVAASLVYQLPSWIPSGPHVQHTFETSSASSPWWACGHCNAGQIIWDLQHLWQLAATTQQPYLSLATRFNPRT